MYQKRRISAEALAKGLAKGAYKMALPLVVNREGLEGIPEGIDLMRVAAEKGQE